MPKKPTVHYKYNPALSVKENAELCGASVATIRKFIKENSIDRRRDACRFIAKNAFFTETSCSVIVPNFAQFVEQNLVRIPSRPHLGKKHKTKRLRF